MVWPSLCKLSAGSSTFTPKNSFTGTLRWEKADRLFKIYTQVLVLYIMSTYIFLNSCFCFYPVSLPTSCLDGMIKWRLETSVWSLLRTMTMTLTWWREQTKQEPGLTWPLNRWAGLQWHQHFLYYSSVLFVLLHKLPTAPYVRL